MKNTKPLIIYFILSYLLSWVVFILLALNHHRIIYLFTDDAAHARIADVWHALGALGPATSAIIILKIFYTKKHFRILLKSYSAKGITLTGWLLAFSPLLYLVFAIVIEKIINGNWFSISNYFRDNNLLSPFNFIAWLLPSITYGIFEETGWRGFALPYLQSKYSAFISSTIISIFWFGWHIPALFYRYEINVAMMFGLFFGIWAGAIYLTYIFNFTKGSLLVVSIWHVVWDFVSIIGKEGVIAAIMSTLIMMLAVFVVLRYKGKNLSPITKTTLQSKF